MKYDRKEYEKLIESSPLFSYDKEKQSAAFRREAYKLIEYLYDCFLAESSEQEYGCEFVETAQRCIRNFDPTSGSFLNYFKSAWKKERGHIRGMQAAESLLHGMKISDDALRNFKAFAQFAGRYDSSMSKKELYRKIADITGMSLAEIEQADEIASLKVTGEMISGSDGNSINVLEGKVSGSDLETEEMLLEKENLKMWLNDIDAVFATLQERQKPILSDLLTIKLCSLLTEHGITPEQYRFINADILRQSRDTGEIPTQRKIAEKYGRDETSVSRTFRIFTEKLKKYKNQG